MNINSSVRKALLAPAVGALAFGALAGVASAATSGTVPATATLTGGSLAIVAPTGINFAGTLDGSDLALTDTATADNTTQVTDATGSGDGWDVTAVASGPFSDAALATGGTDGAPVSGYNDIPEAGFYFDGTPVFAAATGSTATLASNDVTPDVNIPDSGTGAQLFNAAAGTGQGIENVTGTTWNLAVPSNTLAGVYTTTVTESISSGPTSF